MSQLKKVLITVPDALLAQVDSVVSHENINRSEFVREAMKLYLREKKKQSLTEQMKKGYQEMADINLNIAMMCFDADEQELTAYEEKLAECE